MLHEVVLLVFDDPARAAPAMGELRRVGEDGALSVKRAVEVEREPDGGFRLADDAEDPTVVGTALGAALGALVGAAAGPAGLVLGGGAGMAVGSLLDANEARLSEAVVATAVRHVPPGGTAIVADVDERDPGVLDEVASRTGAAAVRVSRADVEAELAAVEAGTRDREVEGRRT